jgi:tRNA-Thr(GGU) m(6)t(6)A37 methyltransferase TsaA
MELRPIAFVHTDFAGKFGIPRQSGLVPELTAVLEFLPEFRSPEAVRGLEAYSHLWLIWEFSANAGKGWSPTVRPPRLGGNRRVGVFASRSPFRPNPLGLSCVRLLEVRLDDPNGPLLLLGGADLMDGTPVYDVKPYVPYADSHPDASGGFTDDFDWQPLEVECPEDLLERFPAEKRRALLGVLAQDPRPAYQEDPDRVYGFPFGGFEVRFAVREGKLRVMELKKNNE